MSFKTIFKFQPSSDLTKINARLKLTQKPHSVFLFFVLKNYFLHSTTKIFQVVVYFSRKLSAMPAKRFGKNWLEKCNACCHLPKVNSNRIALRFWKKSLLEVILILIKNRHTFLIFFFSLYIL